MPVEPLARPMPCWRCCCGVAAVQDQRGPNPWLVKRSAVLDSSASDGGVVGLRPWAELRRCHVSGKMQCNAHEHTDARMHACIRFCSGELRGIQHQAGLVRVRQHWLNGFSNPFPCRTGALKTTSHSRGRSVSVVGFALLLSSLFPRHRTCAARAEQTAHDNTAELPRRRVMGRPPTAHLP